MKLTMEIDETKIEKLIKEVMGNLPEASISLECTGWNYKECKFTFLDYEDGSRYEVDYFQLRKGFGELLNIALGRIKGETFHVWGWDPSKVFSTEPGAWEYWACDWDADVIDGLVQCAIFGEVVYG